MRTDDAIRYYGTAANVARAAEVTRSAVAQWGERVPELSAFRLWMASGGAIPFDPTVYRHRQDTAA